jgi:hypothetical protein
MSGQSAIRGFTYQTIASVIQSLSRSDWEKVMVEPNTTLDKVDIQWESETGEIYCQQVKSSVNNFSKTDIISWLELMILDIPNASRYELFLIGNVANPVNDFIKSIKEHDSKLSINASIDPYIDKISIELVVFNPDYLESKVRDEVSRFLSNANYHLPHATISLIAGGLIYQFLQFSVLGTKVSRTEFSEHIVDWVKFNYSRDLGLETKRSKFAVQFYDVAGRRFVNSMRPYAFQLNDKLFTEKFRLKVIELCRLIVSIELPVRTKPEIDITALRVPIKIPVFGQLSDADVSDDRKEFIRERLKKWFFVQIEDSFFYVGNLKQNLMTFAMPMMGRGYSGTEEEKKKGEAITDLYWELRSIQEIKSLFDQLNSFSYYILIVENSGGSHDEELTINLTIPSSVEVITPDRFYVPGEYDALDVLIKSHFASSILGVRADSLIKEYSFGNFMDIDPMDQLDFAYKLGRTRDRLNLKQDKFVHRIESMMDVEVYTDMPDHMQLRYLFKKLNPGIRMGFPSILFFDSKEDFKIGYEITTKHSPIVHKGELSCLFAPVRPE